MNGYVLSVIGTVLVCSLITAIAPEGKTSALVKGIAKLICVLAIIAPVLKFFKSGSIEEWTGKKNSSQSVIEEDANFIQYYCEMRARETESALESELFEKYEVCAEVSLVWEIAQEELGTLYTEQKMRVEKIYIVIPTETSEEVRNQMQVYLSKNYCSEVLIE